jgi:hypothetical protein
MPFEISWYTPEQIVMVRADIDRLDQTIFLKSVDHTLVLND